jgi:hypothetical protein
MTLVAKLCTSIHIQPHPSPSGLEWGLAACQRAPGRPAHPVAPWELRHVPAGTGGYNTTAVLRCKSEPRSRADCAGRRCGTTCTAQTPTPRYARPHTFSRRALLRKLATTLFIEDRTVKPVLPITSRAAVFGRFIRHVGRSCL